MALVYAVLAPVHLLVLHGLPQQVMPPLALGSALVYAGTWRWLRQGGPRRTLPPALLAVGLLLAMANCLTHLAVARQLEQTAPLLLVVVGAGAASLSRRWLLALLAAAGAGWAVVVATLDAPAALVQHYASQLALAGALSVLLQVVWGRRARDLRRVADDLRARHRDLTIAQAALGQSEQRFRVAFEASPVGIGLADEHGAFVTANAALSTLLGRAEAEIVGRSSVAFTHPEDRAQHGAASALLAAAADGVARVEKRYVRPDGEVRWAWLTLTHVSGPQGQCWTLAHVQDVTDRRAVEQRLRDSESNLAAVAEAGRQIRSSADARGGIVAAARVLAGVRAALLFEQSGHTLQVTAADGLDLVGLRVDLSETSLHAHVVATGTPLFVADVAHHPLVSPALLAASGARSLLIQPLVTRGVVTGALSVLWDRPIADAEEKVVRVVELLADEAASVLEADRLLRELRQHASTDPLTLLPNRRAFDAAAISMLASAAVTGRPVTVAMVDLDHFKAFNDTFGHAAGDTLLRTFAATGSATLRGGDLMARWGGEEFVLALPDTDAATAVVALERLRTVVGSGQTCSVGVASWDGTEDLSTLLQRADTALYVAKNGGRDQLQVSKPLSRIHGAHPALGRRRSDRTALSPPAAGPGPTASAPPAAGRPGPAAGAAVGAVTADGAAPGARPGRGAGRR